MNSLALRLHTFEAGAPTFSRLRTSVATQGTCGFPATQSRLEVGAPAWRDSATVALTRCTPPKRTHLAAITACLVALYALPLGAQDLRIGEHAVLPGGLVSVPVVVSNAAGLASVSLTINYDPQMLSLEWVTNGGLGQTFSVEYGTSEGQVRVAAVSDNALAGGSGALVVLSFRANAGAAAGMASPIALADRRLGGQYGRDFAWSGTVTHSNGNVRVVSATDDQDANGLPDWWEEWYFGAPTGADPAGDADGDGMTNWGEFIAGTNPLDNASVLRVTSGAAETAGFKLRFPTVEGVSYRLLRSETLNSWMAVGGDLAGTGTTVEVIDPDVATASARYYRIQVIH